MVPRWRTTQPFPPIAEGGIPSTSPSWRIGGINQSFTTLWGGGKYENEKKYKYEEIKNIDIEYI